MGAVDRLQLATSLGFDAGYDQRLSQAAIKALSNPCRKLHRKIRTCVAGWFNKQILFSLPQVLI